ncbi:MAG: hypothetical protein AAF990_22025 [Bacteroidota bacterium]
MRNLLILAFLAFVSVSNAQIYVNKVNINDRDLQYVEVWEKYDNDKKRFMGLLDYGQYDDRKNDKDGKMLRITNEEGLAIEFNGIVHVLNFMYRNGWEVMHVKAVDNYESFIMKRKDPFEIQISGSEN